MRIGWLRPPVRLVDRLRSVNRRRSLTRRVLLWIGLLMVQPVQAERPDRLKPVGYVNDFAGVLQPATRERLEKVLAALNRGTGAQVAVVTVRSLEGMPIEEFSLDLATRWGIGPQQSDRGVLILLAVADRKYRIEVGYGLEGILPDGKVGGFGREAVPLLRAGDFDGAVTLLVNRIGREIAAERGLTWPEFARGASPEPAGQSPLPGGLALWGWWLLVLAPLLWWLFLLQLSGGRRRRGRVWGAGGLPGPHWGGGFGQGSGGGFGGFGGGSFGGGGASGSW